MTDWTDIDTFLVNAAEDDLRTAGAIQPCLAARAGSRDLVRVFLRPFAHGAMLDPLVEAMALVMLFGADNLALSAGGRITSLEDPIPPVVDGVGDLRQTALVITRADARRRREPLLGSTLRPYDLAGGTVRWHEPFDPGAPEGWIGATLALALRERRKLRGPREAQRDQALRCIGLGHTVALANEVAERLDLPQVRSAPAPTTPGVRPAPRGDAHGRTDAAP